MSLRVTDFFDPPVVFDAADLGVPGSGSAPLQVVASLADNVKGIHFLDGIGQHIGVWVGPVGLEELACVVGGGIPATIPVEILVGSRVSIKSMKPDPITSGTLCFHFLTDK